MAEHRSYEDRTKKSYRGVEPMNAAEKAALDRIRESLEEFPDSRMAQYVTAEDLKILLRLIERSTKKPCDK
jgi:hypothetical protein